ncbi:MAG: hypothetical protein WBC93_07180 [Sulfitobacter sp.]
MIQSEVTEARAANGFVAPLDITSNAKAGALRDAFAVAAAD